MQLVVAHGLTCFHDIGVWPGVTRFYEELIPSSAAYREVGKLLSLRVVEKTAPPRRDGQGAP